MISAIARSSTGRDLLRFADRCNVGESWDEVSQVTASLVGTVFDQQFDVHEQSNEMIVNVVSNENSVSVNLCQLFALAAAYVKEQYELAQKSVDSRANVNRAVKLSLICKEPSTIHDGWIDGLLVSTEHTLPQTAKILIIVNGACQYVNAIHADLLFESGSINYQVAGYAEYMWVFSDEFATSPHN
jgi:hypothetical protein